MAINHNFRRVPILALLVLLLVAGAIYIPASGASASGFQNKVSRSLSFFNTHTHETLDVTYWQSGRYVESVQSKINWELRDHRANADTQMSRELMNLLHDIKLTLQDRYPEKDIVFNIISGYRSPKTNAMLRANGGGQAKQSRHMHGDAIDVRVPGVPSSEIRDIAWCMQRGGVGYYRGSDFVHVDTSKVRFWNWRPTANTCQ